MKDDVVGSGITGKHMIGPNGEYRLSRKVANIILGTIAAGGIYIGAQAGIGFVKMGSTFYDNKTGKFLEHKPKKSVKNEVVRLGSFDCELDEKSPSLAREGILEMICRENPALDLKREDLLNGKFVGLYEATLKINDINENTQISPLKKYIIPYVWHR